MSKVRLEVASKCEQAVGDTSPPLGIVGEEVDLSSSPAMKITRSQSARARARELFAQREAILGYLLSALDKQREMDPIIGYTLNQLTARGVSKPELAQLTGLSAARIRELMNEAPEQIEGLDFDSEAPESKNEPDEKDDTAAPHPTDSSDDFAYRHESTEQ